MRHRTLRSAMLALALSLVSFGVGGQEREPVKIGLIFTNTGPLAQLGIDMRDGNLLYWSQVGGRAGARRVELLTESTGSNKPDEGLTKARKLVERDHVQILTGVLETPVAYALSGYVNDKKIPLMINIAGADGLSQKQRSEYVCRSSRPTSPPGTSTSAAWRGRSSPPAGRSSRRSIRRWAPPTWRRIWRRSVATPTSWPWRSSEPTRCASSRSTPNSGSRARFR